MLLNFINGFFICNEYFLMFWLIVFLVFFVMVFWYSEGNVIVYNWFVIIDL